MRQTLVNQVVWFAFAVIVVACLLFANALR